jgi:uncharacterized protein
MQAETVQLIQRDAWRMECLEAVESLDLPDWYIAAGFLRNTIWDALHDKPERRLSTSSITTAGTPGAVDEMQIEAALKTRCPEVKWEARNQARMHLFKERVREKRWLEHWPRLQVCWPSGTGP